MQIIMTMTKAKRLLFDASQYCRILRKWESFWTKFNFYIGNANLKIKEANCELISTWHSNCICLLKLAVALRSGYRSTINGISQMRVTVCWPTRLILCLGDRSDTHLLSCKQQHHDEISTHKEFEKMQNYCMLHLFFWNAAVQINFIKIKYNSVYDIILNRTEKFWNFKALILGR